MAKKVIAPAQKKDEPKDRRCSFRAVKSSAKKKVGMGPLTIEYRLPGSTIWNPSISGLDAEDVENDLRRMENQGCGIEYNEFFQLKKAKKRVAA